MTVPNIKEKPMYVTTKNLDIKSIVIKKLEEIVEKKYSLLKVKAIYFEKDGGDISYISVSDGYNILIRKDGSRVFPRAVNGHELLDIINCLRLNRFYGYITDADNKKYKIRPKNKK